MAEKEFVFFFFGAEERLSHFVLHVKRRRRGPEDNDHSIVIGERSLSLDKNLYF